jgi:mono/diheme cytochrome c family protein
MRHFAALFVLLSSTAFAAAPQYLPQNWSETDRQWFYTTPQGSKLIKYSWALNLERADDQTLFFADGLAHLGYLPNAKSAVNPDGLPVGFVKDTSLLGNDLGMSCAACHTNQIEYQGTMYRVDGGPTDGDLFGFLAELGESLTATSASRTDPKFLRFAKRVLGSHNNFIERDLLYRELKKYTTYFNTFVDDTTPSTQWGKARADAFGAIFNRVTAIDLKIPANNRPPNAPVSYPFLWDTSWHNVVQWNGSAPNQLAILRLARNVGEVLGVFANIKIETPHFLHWYYESTAKRINLLEIEDRLAKLRSPKWPASFPPIDAAKAAQGQVIYNAQCLSCHAIATPGQHQDVTMTPLATVGTDPAMVTVAADRQALTGVLQGVPALIFLGDKFGTTAGAGAITFNAVIGAILSPIPSDWFWGTPSTAKTETARMTTSTRTGEGSENDLREDLLSKMHRVRSKVDDVTARTTDPVKLDLDRAAEVIANAPAPGLAYKARPMDGIWATAPYLHNGSVPTLRDLFTAEGSRPKTFYVGSRAFDPVNVGFSTTQAPGTFLFDTSVAGNSNQGHTWGTTLSATEVDQLIEYLKSL